MKKAIISAALMALAASATAQVTVYGRLNATVDSTKTGTVKTNSMVNDISHLGFRVSEDLGKGMTARAVIETGITSQDPVAGADTQMGNRQSTVGLASKAGSVDLGRSVHGVFTTLADGDSFGALYGSVAGDVHNLRGLRLSNGAFVRVTALPGIGLGMDRTHTAAGNEAVIYSATAKVAGLNVAAAKFDQGAEKSTVVSVNVRRGNTGLFYSHSDNEGIVKQKGNLMGVSQKMGAVTVKAGYGKTDSNIKAYNVGADYAFSKRTAMSVGYRNVDRAGSASDVKQIGVGVTHHF